MPRIRAAGGSAGESAEPQSFLVHVVLMCEMPPDLARQARGPGYVSRATPAGPRPGPWPTNWGIPGLARYRTAGCTKALFWP
jgi:hypothetical protein